MLSLGAAAIWFDPGAGWQQESFSTNLEDLPGAVRDPRTMLEFWSKNPDAWAAVMRDRRDIQIAMEDFHLFLKRLQGKTGRRPVAVCAPAGYDYTFLRWYMIRFLGSDKPLGHSCIDLKSVAADRLGSAYHTSGKSMYPAHWFKDQFPHTHIAVDDAIEQAWLFARIVDERY